MLAGILLVAGSFLTHYVPFIGPFLGGGLDTLAAILQVIARGGIG
jgi:hypothetical protein